MAETDRSLKTYLVHIEGSEDIIEVTAGSPAQAILRACMQEGIDWFSLSDKDITASEKRYIN